jgi:hypothetical protein
MLIKWTRDYLDNEIEKFVADYENQKLLEIPD